MAAHCSGFRSAFRNRAISTLPYSAVRSRFVYAPCTTRTTDRNTPAIKRESLTASGGQRLTLFLSIRHARQLGSPLQKRPTSEKLGYDSRIERARNSAESVR